MSVSRQPENNRGISERVRREGKSDRYRELNSGMKYIEEKKRRIETVTMTHKEGRRKGRKRNGEEKGEEKG